MRAKIFEYFRCLSSSCIGNRKLERMLSHILKRLTRLPLWKSDFLELIIAAGLFLWLFAGGILFKIQNGGKTKFK